MNTFCKKRGPDFNTEILKKLEKVTADDLKNAMTDVYIKIFDPARGSIFVACHPSKVESIHKYFESLSYDITVEEIFDDEDDSENGSGDNSGDYSGDN